MLNGTIIVCNYQENVYGFSYGENKRSTKTYTYEIKSQVSVEQTRNQYMLLC